jgi:hypothetical protein
VTGLGVRTGSQEQWLGYLSAVAEIVGERRGKAGIVADSFCVIGRVESPVGNALGVIAEGIDFAEGAHDLLVVVNVDHAVVVLVADQGMTVPEPHGARGQRAGAPPLVAVCIGIGEVLPHNVLVLINLDDAGVIRIRDKRVAVLQPAGKSDTTDRIADVWVTAAVLPDNLAGARDLDGAVVVFVADEDVTILQKLGAVRVVELLGAVAGDAGGAVLPDDLLGQIDLDDALVRLIGDEYVATRNPGILYGGIELIGASARDAELPILPEDASHAVNQQHTVVRAAVRIGAVGCFGLTARGAGTGHQRQRADALRIIDADDGRW